MDSRSNFFEKSTKSSENSTRDTFDYNNIRKKKQKKTYKHTINEIIVIKAKNTNGIDKSNGDKAEYL